MLLAPCTECEHLVEEKCSKENLYPRHTSCILKKALTLYLRLQQTGGPVGLHEVTE
jgi:hypothetical protein